jgi:hypothetical protein
VVVAVVGEIFVESKLETDDHLSETSLALASRMDPETLLNCYMLNINDSEATCCGYGQEASVNIDGQQLIAMRIWVLNSVSVNYSHRG